MSDPANMTVETPAARVQALVEEVIFDSPLFLVDLIVRGHKGSRVVEVYLDSDRPLDVDALARISREVGFLLDTEEVIDGKYTLNDEFEELSTVAREFAHVRHRHRVEDLTESFTILWESLDEFLVQTRAEIEGDAFHLTGPELFQAYDLPLMARQRRYYLYSESVDEVSPAELCCHMLVIDDGTRSQSYCLLLISETAIERDELLETAEKYEVDERVSNLLEYLDTEGESRSGRLPRWEEFRELADDYGVAV